MPSYCSIISIKFAKKDVVRSPITSLCFVYRQKQQSYDSRMQNNAYDSHKSRFRNASLSFHFCFKLCPERDGQSAIPCFALVSLRKSNRIILVYKTMCTTHIRIDLGKPSYCFIFSLILQSKGLLGVQLLCSSLFSLKRGSHISHAYKRIRTTHTSLDLWKPPHYFIIFLKFENKEVVRSPAISFQFTCLKMSNPITLAYKTMRLTQVKI